MSISTTKTKPRKKRKSFKPLIVILVLAVIAVAAYFFLPGRQQEVVESTYVEAPVTTGDLTKSLSAGGTLAPADSYTVTTLVDGDILTDTFEEGDFVEKDDVLYTLDSSDMEANVEMAEIALEASQRAYSLQLDSLADLTITSPITGTIYDMDISVGDQIVTNQVIGHVRDNTVLEVELYFLSDEVDTFYLGQSGTLTLDGSFETITGTISHISSLEEVLTGNQLVREVTFQVPNYGGLSQIQRVSGAIGIYTSLNSSYLQYTDDRDIVSDGTGTVSQVNVKKGDNVSSGQALVILSSDTIDNSVKSAAEAVRNAELSLETTENAMDYYTIDSPIAGTIIEKNYKAGETISTAGEVLCIIYDLSHLEMTLNIDELEILDVEPGQVVEIEPDSMTDTMYYGVVTKVSQVGTTVSSMTSYPVTVEITEYDGLLSGMNVTSTIIIAEVSDVITVPIEAIQRGDTILVTADSPSAQYAVSTTEEGYCAVPVETGVANDEFVEVTSGLTDQDTIVYIPTVRSNEFSPMDMIMGSAPSGGPMGG